MNELAKLKDLINDYWDMAYTEGLGLGSQGTVAQEKLSEIDNAIDALIKERDALKARLEQEPVSHTVIAGALFDFMGYLTSRQERIVLSAADDASPAVDAIRDFAKKRGLSLDDAQVREWIDNLAQPKHEIQNEEKALELQGLVKEFFEKYLNRVEESDGGKEFHPITVSCCRVMMSNPLDALLDKMSKLSGAEPNPLLHKYNR